MPTSIILTLLGITVSASVALYIAFMQRQQMRQIELHKLDPTVPLKPPTHAVVRWINDYGLFIVVIGSQVYLLLREIKDPAPVTRRDVVDISIHVVTVAGNLYFMGMIAILNRAIARAKRGG